MTFADILYSLLEGLDYIRPPFRHACENHCVIVLVAYDCERRYENVYR